MIRCADKRVLVMRSNEDGRTRMECVRANPHLQATPTGVQVAFWKDASNATKARWLRDNVQNEQKVRVVCVSMKYHWVGSLTELTVVAPTKKSCTPPTVVSG